ncbi:MAG: cation diffusion facilitator family transporter [Myxococcales bacterium]|nr:cation diffusion facilitator family transporter [Myxococcales bacterium]
MSLPPAKGAAAPTTGVVHLTRPHTALRWAVAALVVSALITAAKFAAWVLTDSTAVFSDALESIINVVTASFALFSVWLATLPRDETHPYGHGRIEYFSAGLEGAFICLASLTIMAVAIPELFHARAPERLDAGLLLTVLIGVVTMVSGQQLQRAGRRLESPTLEADGAHLTSDALTTLGVFAGLLLVRFTGWNWVDPATGLLMALWLLATGVSILRRAIGALMDEAVPDLLDAIGEVLETTREPGWNAPHHVKVHRLGQRIHIDLHLVLPRFWTLEQSHEVSERIEYACEERFGGETELMSHLEPCTDRACSSCDLDECPIRAVPFEGRERWTHDVIRRPYRHRKTEPATH